MIPETNKLTPIIYELQHYEEILSALEKDDLRVQLSGNNLLLCGLSNEIEQKILTTSHAIITAEVKRLQREFKDKLKEIR